MNDNYKGVEIRIEKGKEIIKKKIMKRVISKINIIN